MRKKFPDCPKCGEDDPSVKYHAKKSGYPCTLANSNEEHFDVRCYRCDYMWSVKFDLPFEEPIELMRVE